MRLKALLISIPLLVFVGLLLTKQTFPIKHKAIEKPAELTIKSILMQQPMRLQFFKILKEFEIRTMAHIPCGKADWMQEMSLKIEKYIGVDLSQEIIESNRQNYGSQDYHFQTMDIAKDLLPKVDLILCEESLNQFSQSNIKAAFVLFKKSGATYLLTTSYSKLEKNKKTNNGTFRPINFEIAPYYFPKPLLSIDLNTSDGKRWCLWKLDQLP